MSHQTQLDEYRRLEKGHKERVRESAADNATVTGGWSCCASILMFLNLIYLAGAGTLIGLTIYAMKTNVAVLVGNHLPWVLVGIGAAVAVLAFIGCVGACRENRCLLFLYATLLFLMIAAEVTVGAMVYTKRHDARDIVTDAWQRAPDSDKRAVQSELHCCGLFSYATAALPCEWFDTPCANLVKEKFEHWFTIIGAVAIAVALLQLVGVMMPCCLIRAISHAMADAREEADLADARAANRLYV